MNTKSTPVISFFKILSLCILTGVLVFNFTNANAQALPHPDHVVILIEENQANTYVIGNTTGLFGNPTTYAPYINQMANDSMSAILTGVYALTHPSQPNYLDFFAGSDQGVTDDNLPTGYPYTTPNLARELLDAGHSFVTYSPDLPSVGSDVVAAGGYVRKHNPVTNWVGTGTNQVPDTCNQPFSTWPTDFSKLPTVCYVVPTEDSDMHNGNPPATITVGDYWFKTYLSSFMDWARTHNTLFIFTFDEDDGLENNNIPTFFFGPMVKHGTYSDTWDLYSILRTIEDMYGTGHAGAAATKVPILNVWKTVSGINNLAEETGLKVYPNPASSTLRFNSDNILSTAEISVSDLTGRVISQYHMDGVKNLEVDISAFPAGLYFYRVEQNSTQPQTGKFIIAR